MILADKIIDERKRLGLSQEELAEKLNVSRQAVSKWEGAQSIPDLQRIVANIPALRLSRHRIFHNLPHHDGTTGSALHCMLQ